MNNQVITPKTGQYYDISWAYGQGYTGNHPDL